MKRRPREGDYVAINLETDELVGWGATIKEAMDAAEAAGVDADKVMVSPVLPEDLVKGGFYQEGE